MSRLRTLSERAGPRIGPSGRGIRATAGHRSRASSGDHFPRRRPPMQDAFRDRGQTGFFESVAETAYMRTTHIVDMDRSAGRAEGHNVTEASLSQFAVALPECCSARPRRHRAIGTIAPRLAKSRLRAVRSCPYQSECHAIFGEVDGYGLYPFTIAALGTPHHAPMRRCPKASIHGSCKMICLSKCSTIFRVQIADRDVPAVQASGEAWWGEGTSAHRPKPT